LQGPGQALRGDLIRRSRFANLLLADPAYLVLPADCAALHPASDFLAACPGLGCHSKDRDSRKAPLTGGIGGRVSSTACNSSDRRPSPRARFFHSQGKPYCPRSTEAVPLLRASAGTLLQGFWAGAG